MAKNDLNKDKEEFIQLLNSTERDGVDDLIEYLESENFFTAPASSTKHLCSEGGLVKHSLNTCKVALMIWENMQELYPNLHNEVTKDSVIIASLLHDVCKADIYFRTMRRKKVLGEWEDVEGYKVSYKNFPMGHGEKSVILLLCAGLTLYDEEMLAIRWHMGAWGVNQNSFEELKSYDTANKKYPLVSIIQCADSLAANLIETVPEDLEDL